MGGSHRRYDDEGRLPRPSLSSWITGPGRYAAGTAAAVLAVSGAGVGFVVHQSSGSTPRADAGTTLSSCGLVNCADLGTASSGAAPATTPVSSTHLGSATTTHRSPESGQPAVVPAGATPTDAPSSSGAAPTTPTSPAKPPAPSPTLTTPTPSPAPAPTTPAPTPSPTTPSPSPSAAASPDVTVTYSTSPHHRDGFFGHLTIENLGTAPVSGWQLVLMLPGDDVDWVWNAQWQLSGDTLTLTPANSGDVIEPGASVSVNFSASGDTTAPTSCTFNGAACTSS